MRLSDPRFLRRAVAALALLVAAAQAAALFGTLAAGPAGAATPAAAVPAAAAPRASDPDTPGARALREVSARFQSLSTFSAEFEQVQAWVGADDSPAFRGTLYLKRPNLFRMEYKTPAGHLQVSDGKTVWTYVPENREVIATSLEGEPGKGGDLLRWVLETGRADPEVGEEQVEGGPARVITITPSEGLGLSQVRLWTRPGSPELLRYEITDDAGNRNVYTLHKVRYNPRLSDALFRFAPPPGVPVVELGKP